MSHRDLQDVLRFVRASHEHADRESFVQHVSSGLRRLLAADIASYNEIDPRTGRYHFVTDPSDAVTFRGSREAFARHIGEHPVLRHFQSTGDSSAHTISDFLTRSEFERLGLYAEFYRHAGVNHQIAIELPASLPLVIGIAVSRRLHDYDARDRLVLDRLRPHLAQAHRNIEMMAALRAEVGLVEQAVARVSEGLVLLDPDGTIRWETPRARQWIAEYFGTRPLLGGRRLPDDLDRWARDQSKRRTASTELTPVPASLTAERGDRRVVVEFFSDAARVLLLLREESRAADLEALADLGLTSREVEVLRWVAAGKTNADIALIVGARPRTIAKHLERAFRKLGVETRTAAVARMAELAARAEGSS